MGKMKRRAKIFIFSFLVVCLAQSILLAQELTDVKEEGAIKGAEKVVSEPNRAIILGQVQKLEKDFPYVKLTVRVVRSYAVENYANFIEEGEVIQIQPDYIDREFEISSFFEDERRVRNLQAYYFLPGDYFFAEVSLSEKERWVYFDIQRINEELVLKEVLKEVKEPEEFLEELEEFLKKLDEFLEHLFSLSIWLKEPFFKPPQEYAKLASVLYRLVQSPNRCDFAEKHKLYLFEDKVRVVIELISGCDELREDYGMVVEKRGENLIKALVPIEQLLYLAVDACVGFIRPPHVPLPLSTNQEGN